MILHDLPPGTTLFRVHTPQWASRPTSGAGAAQPNTRPRGPPGDFSDNAQRLDVLLTGSAKPRRLLRLGGVEEPMSLASLKDARESAQGLLGP